MSEKPTTEPTTPTPEQVERHVLALADSVALINAEVAKEWSDERGVIVKCNVDHIELMLVKPFIVAHPSDKSALNNAVVAGKAYVAANK